jgi:hypothetical protein
MAARPAGRSGRPGGLKMPTAGDDVLRLLRRIQAGKIELENLERRRASATELQARERALEQLRWQLAAVVRRSAHDDLGTAA